MTIPHLVLIDYGMGNLGSVQNALHLLGQEAHISSTPCDMAHADAFVLPGVGAFGEAMMRLESSGLIAPLAEQVLGHRKPLLGICLGMQLLAEDSLEHGFHRGLGWIDGHVRPIPAAAGVRVPHVGWSEVDFKAGDPLFRNIDPGACFYFDHSYYLECDPALVVARSRYGVDITAMVRHGNIMATQFHPEKSQRAGLKLLRNFLNLCAEQRAAA